MPAAKKPATTKTTRRRTTKPAVIHAGRNLHSVPAYVPTSEGGRIEFMPRGMRGDMTALTVEQLKDPKVNANVGVVIELLTKAEFDEIDTKQRINQQAAPRPIHAMLRDPVGAEYENQPDTVVADHGHVKSRETFPINPATGEVYRSHREGVGPRIVTNLPGADPEYAQLLGADDAARSGEDLVDQLRNRR